MTGLQIAEELLREITELTDTFDDVNRFAKRVSRFTYNLFRDDPEKAGSYGRWIDDIVKDKSYYEVSDSVYYYTEEQWHWHISELKTVISTIIDDIRLASLANSSSNFPTENPPLQQPIANFRVAAKSDRIFIVHGHDDAMKANVARVIDRLGLTCVILHEQPNRGRTIIEKFEDYADVSYAVVLLSPDDQGSAYGNHNPQFRARQNVVFELGFFIGSLGRANVFVLHKKVDNFEFPTDIAGVLYVPFDENGGWQLKLAQELAVLGYDVDPLKLLTN